MKQQVQQPAPVSRTLQGKAKTSCQASVADVLQAYKKDISQQQEVDEDELLQGKFETAQRDELEDDELLQGKLEPAQLDELEDDELLQGKFETTQRQELEDDELLQGKFEPIQRQEAPNNTGLPDNLKAGVEQLSGLDMSDVKVHYNSSKPASVQAYAYTQGTDIHVAPGQEKHLGHEAWHVAQQKQGRVQPTTTVGRMLVNDNIGLESEADVMGGKAVQMKPKENKSWIGANSAGQMKGGGKKGIGIADYRSAKAVQTNTLQAKNETLFNNTTNLPNGKARRRESVHQPVMQMGLYGWLKNRILGQATDEIEQIKVKGEFKDGTIGWTYMYNVEFKYPVATIHVDFYMSAGNVAQSERESYEKIIKTKVAEIYDDKIKVKYGDREYKVQVSVDFMYEDIVTRIYLGNDETEATLNERTIKLIQGEGRSDALNLYFKNDKNGVIAAHEIGHHLGLVDEYEDTKMSKDRKVYNDGGIMANTNVGNPHLPERNIEQIRKEIQTNIDKRLRPAEEQKELEKIMKKKGMILPL